MEIGSKVETWLRPEGREPHFCGTLLSLKPLDWLKICVFMWEYYEPVVSTSGYLLIKLPKSQTCIKLLINI